MSGEHSFSQASRGLDPLPDRIHVPGRNAHEETVTSDFRAVAYHVPSGYDNRLEIRRKTRRQGAGEVRSAFRTGAHKNYEKTKLDLIAGALGIVAGAAFITRSSWMGSNASAQAPARPRIISVEVAKAERKPVPVDVDAIGMVTPISSVALKSRLETTITAVHFEDGAKVNEGDLLFTLDARQIDAQIEQAEGTLAKDQAQLEGALRDLRRYTDLVAKGATTQVNVDNAKTQSDTSMRPSRPIRPCSTIYKVQKSYSLLRSPFTGRISAANVKIGNFVRPADLSPLRSSTRWRRSTSPSRFPSVCWSTCARPWQRTAQR